MSDPIWLASLRRRQVRQHAEPSAVDLAIHIGHPFVGADRLASDTGGRTWSAGSNRQLEELFTRALNEMRARYVLTYSVRAPNKPGWHKIQVGLRNASGDVTARPGYMAP